MRRSISQRIIVYFIAATIFVVCAAAFLDYQFSRRQILADLEVEAQQSLAGLVEEIDDWLTHIQGSTEFFAALLADQSFSEKEMVSLLHTQVSRNQDIFGAAIALNPDLAEGNARFAPLFFEGATGLVFRDLAAGETDYTTEKWFQRALNRQQPFWLEPYRDMTRAAVPIATFAVPVRRLGADGRMGVFAVVTADVTLEALQSRSRKVKLRGSGYAFVLSRLGRIVAMPRDDDLLEPITQWAEARDAVAAWDQLLQETRSGGEPRRDVSCELANGRCTARLTSLSTTGWPIGLVYSPYLWMEPLRLVGRKQVLIGIAGILTLSLIVIVMIRRMTRPLETLARVADEIARGNLDTGLPAARHDDEVAQLLRSFESMQGNLRRQIRKLSRETAARSRLEGELDAARQIQKSMLPDRGESFIERRSYSMWASIRAAKTVSGDLYYYHERERNRLLFAVGDVSDKGAPAALFMARAMSHIQQLSVEFDRPDRILERLNNLLEDGNDSSMFLTLFLGFLDLRTFRLAFASAGQNAPVRRHAGQTSEMEQETGPALGLYPDEKFPLNEVVLAAGDTLMMVTDGVEEAFNEAHAMFGMERVIGLLDDGGDSNVKRIGKRVFRSVDAYRGDFPQSDDITVLVLHLAEQDAAIDRVLLDPGTRYSSIAGEWLMERLARRSLAAEQVNDVVLVAEEALTNIVKYAELGPTEMIELELAASVTEIRLVITDAGLAFDPLLQGERSPLGEATQHAPVGGLGVHLIEQLTDEQYYRREGGRNVLTLVKRLAATGEDN